MGNATYNPRGKLVDGYPVREHPNYHVWANIKGRCLNSNHSSYKNYGGRGIDMDPSWAHFEAFCSDMGVRPSQRYSIDRIDNCKGYWKSNCRWATSSEQCHNRRLFKNNSTGAKGVVQLKCGRFQARYNTCGKRYTIGGSFATVEDAIRMRGVLIKLLESGKPVDHLLERPARHDSTTNIRGITPHTDGGYLVRTTHNGERAYLGYFKTLSEAIKRLEEWKLSKR